MTSVNNNPFDGKHVCFEINSIAGAEVKKHLKIDEFPPDAIVNKHGKKLIYCVVCKPVPKSTNLYNVVWNYTGLQPMNMSGDWICTGMLLDETIKIMERHETARLQTGKSNKDNDGDDTDDVDDDDDIDIQKFFHECDALDEGDPLDSDVEMEDNQEEEYNMDNTDPKIRPNKSFLSTRIIGSAKDVEEIDGITWEPDGDLGEPPEKSNLGTSTLKEKYLHMFDTPLRSMLAFLPLRIWIHICNESNRYAHQVMKETKKPKIAGYRWKEDISLQEFMQFIGILIMMTTDPLPGRSYTYMWHHPDKYPYIRCMKLYRFKQIQAAWHCTYNKHEENSKDALVKVRPL